MYAMKMRNCCAMCWQPGIIEELDNYAVARMSNILDGIEITVMGGKRDGV